MATYRFRFIGDGATRHMGQMLKRGDELTLNFDIRQHHPNGHQRYQLIEEDSEKRRTSQRNTAAKNNEPETMETDERAAEPRSQLVIQPRGRGWYDVVNEATEEKLNSVSLRYDDALKLTEE